MEPREIIISTPLLDSVILNESELAPDADEFAARAGMVKFPEEVTVESAREVSRILRTDIRGHQMVMFNHGGERVVFLGDIVPTPHHLNLGVISAFDNSPETTLEQKKDLLHQAERQGWLLVFSHGHDTKAGYLERRGMSTYLRPVEL